MATGPVVDQLATEYAAAGKPVVFLEQNVDAPLGSRIGRWWAAHGGGSVSLPLCMVSSGHQFSNGYLGAAAHDTYQAMVEAELARPAQAEIQATAQVQGTRMHFEIDVTNLSGVPLSTANAATVHVLAYEEHTPIDPSTDHITRRIVRGAAAQSISTALAHGAAAHFTLETGDMTNVVDWSKIHTVVLVDYRPGGASGAYDMLQALALDLQPSLAVSKQAAPDPVSPGGQITYTIRATNTGALALHATITDTLPAHVSPGGAQVWTATIAPQGTWEQTYVVTVDAGYAGALVNRVEVTTTEGAAGSGVAISNGFKVYLPVTMRDRGP